MLGRLKSMHSLQQLNGSSNYGVKDSPHWP